MSQKFITQEMNGTFNMIDLRLAFNDLCGKYLNVPFRQVQTCKDRGASYPNVVSFSDPIKVKAFISPTSFGFS